LKPSGITQSSDHDPFGAASSARNASELDGVSRFISSIAVPAAWKFKTTANRYRIKSDLVDLELLDDSETVAAICAELNSMGKVLVCYGCGDVEALIVGFLVLDHKKQVSYRIHQKEGLCCVELFAAMQYRP
jgi:hypothetical protein